jgi:hypothetical protein
MGGERSTFDTQLPLPPGEATRVRLSFAGGQSIPIVAAGARAANDRAEAPAAKASEPNTTIPEQH